MATGYVSGETMLRPVRVGLAIMPGSAAGLRRAVELAVGSWGGQAFPIVEAAADPRAALRRPVGDDDELRVLAKAPGFEWVASWQGLSPFNRDPEGRGEHVLPASALYDWYRLSRLPQPTVYHVTWPRDHALADLLAVWFACFGDDDAGQADRAAFEAVAQGCPLGHGLSLPPWPMSMASQLSITMQDVFQQPRWQSRGIVVVENGNVSHLASFWNLRACGQEVSPGWNPRPTSWKSRSRNGLRGWPRLHRRFQVGCRAYRCGSRPGRPCRRGSVRSPASAVSSSCPNSTIWTRTPAVRC
jgi:hypothetical protein